MTVGGDPAGVRSLHLSYGASAGLSHDQGTTLAGAYDAIGPANFAGGAAENWRSYTSQLQAANGAMSKAFDRVGSFLPRVADAIEETQKAEQAEIKAADAVATAQRTLTDAEATLRAAEAAVTSPLSIARSPLATGPSTEELAAVTAAQLQVTTAQRTLTTAQQQLQRAKHAFEEAEHHRQSVLRQLATLCHSEVASVQAAMPPGQAPSFAFSQGLLTELQHAEQQLLEIPAIAGSWLAPDLMPGLQAAVAQDARTPTFPADLSTLYQLATRPLSSFVPRPVHHSGGGGLLGWLGTGAVVLGSIGLIAVSGGTDTPAVLSGDAALEGAAAGGASAVGGISTAAGISGLVSVGFTGLDDLVHGQPIDPKGLIIAGSTGWLAAAIPVGLSGQLPGDAAKLPSLLATRAATGAVTTAGLNAASQQYLYNRVDWGTVGIAGAGGVWAGAWPGAGDTSAILDSTPARVAMSLHQSEFPAAVSAGTDGAGPSPAHHASGAE